jgi:prevent-host-death family protein
MTVINVRAAKAQFSHLLARVATGEEIVITKAGKPVAKLTSLTSRTPRLETKRRLGRLEGRAVIPADFDAPLPHATLDTFEGG